ncbi:MAG: serine/threonine-protein kinase [Vulcanimicrobiota bacterium]
MKFLLVAALICLVLEALVWRPRPAAPVPEHEYWIRSIPPARYTLNGRSGITPVKVNLSDRVHLEHFGYLPEDVKYRFEPVEMRLSATGFVIFNAPLWAALACLAGAARLRLHPRQEARMVGPYRIYEQVGRGATAEVYRASGPQGEKVALKWLHEHTGGTEEFANRFRREAEICAGLSHHGIVRVYDWGEHEGRLWMSQEWIDGPTLEQKPVPPGEVLRLLKRLCQALDYAHRAGVIHRDLKPSNILLRADGSPVIADFGLARSAHYETITKTETTLGTPTYMPPEQILGQGSDGRSDLYSLGCLIYWLWLGRLPFLGADPIKTLLAHLHEPVPSMPEQPPGWAELVGQLLSKDREQRPASASQVLDRLNSLGPLM